MAKRIAIGIVGGSVLVVGVCMIVLPGPAFVVIPVGLGILGLEFAWARSWLKKVKAKAAGSGPQLHRTATARTRPPRLALATRSAGRTSAARTNRTGGDPYDNTLS